MFKRYFSITLLVALALIGCAAEPQTVEVTRLINQEVPVTVEVTREITLVTTVEVPVEVTRLVEVILTPTPLPTQAEPTPTTEAQPTATASATPVAGSSYTVQAGDTLASIAARTGTTAAAIQSANNLSNPNVLTAGQVLIIPGWDGVLQVAEATTTVAATAVPTSPPPSTEPVVQGPNLLPNPSFEGDWYFHLYNELQVPDGWMLATDEGPNTLEGGAGGFFNRPEVRVVPAQDLPPGEQSLFISDGNKTVKAFKGGAPTSFSLYTDVALPPGTYRMRISFFSDTVVAYEGGQKIYASDPLAAEARIIFNDGGTFWQGTQSGQRNAITYDFTLTSAQTVRVGGSFRNRFVMANNGWFLDNWSLHALTTP